MGCIASFALGVSSGSIVDKRDLCTARLTVRSVPTWNATDYSRGARQQRVGGVRQCGVPTSNVHSIPRTIVQTHSSNLSGNSTRESDDLMTSGGHRMTDERMSQHARVRDSGCPSRATNRFHPIGHAEDVLAASRARIHKVHVDIEHLARANASPAPSWRRPASVPVSHRRRDDEPSPAALTHACDPYIDTREDAPGGRATYVPNRPRIEVGCVDG